MKMQKWTCEKCGSEIRNRGEVDQPYELDVYNADGDYLGYIDNGYEEQMLDALNQLNNGGCPICDGWEDGAGNSCTEDGWGKEPVKTTEEIWQEVDAKMMNLAEFFEEADLDDYDPDTDTGTVRYIEDLNEVRQAFFDDIEKGIESDVLDQEPLDEFLKRHKIRFDDWRPY